jgi:lysophospholipase L1-like esterase
MRNPLQFKSTAKCAGCHALWLAFALALIACFVHPGTRDAIGWRIDKWLGGNRAPQLRFEQTLDSLHRRTSSTIPIGSVVVLGDSHMHGAVLPISPRVTANFSIGGVTAQRMAMLASRYDAVQTASAVVFMIGHNDLNEGGTPTDIVRAYGQLLRLTHRVPHRVCIGLLPVNSRLSSKKSARIASNAEIRAACEQSNAIYVSADHVLADASGSLRPEFDSGDGVHLSAQGYSVLMPLIANACCNRLN